MKRIVRYAGGILAGALMTVAAGSAFAGWQAFAAQLESLGWTVIEEADGSLTLYPPSGGTVSGIGDVVTVRGWDITREADGSLSLTRSQGAGPDAAPPPTTKAPPPAQLLDPAAATYLESLGWGVERAEDGSVLLFPPGKIERPAGQVFEPVVEPAPASDRRLMDEATIGGLRDRGWTVESADDGSILLYPPAPVGAPAPDTAPEPVSPPPEAGTITTGFSDDAVLELLEQRGWTVERAPDGSLLLYPRDYRAPPAEAATGSLPGACAGHSVTALAAGQVTPPLDDLADVQAIAEAWVADTGMDGVTVGRIRQVFRIYLVSVVDAAPPHRLRHQIAIGRDNGRVIPLD